MAFEDKMLSNQTTAATTDGNDSGINMDGGEINFNQEPKDLQTAKLIITSLRVKSRDQTERLLAWKKAYRNQEEINFRQQRKKTEQLNAVTSQLLLLQSRLMRKQKQISNILGQRDMTIMRQHKIIESLSQRLIDLNGYDPTLMFPGIDGSFFNGGIGLGGDFDSLNDSDSAVVLEDIDSDCNSTSMISSASRGRKPGSSDVTIIRSISDAIETNLNKYSNVRRSNCFLRRPDILETVYSVEEDPEPQQGGNSGINNSNCNNNSGGADGIGNNFISHADISEKRGKFKQHRTEKIVEDQLDREITIWKVTSTSIVDKKNNQCDSRSNCNTTSQVTNYNRVMSNHRNVTKPKDVKYKRINKAKSKSLEELRGKLRHWVEKGSTGTSTASTSPINDYDPVYT